MDLGYCKLCGYLWLPGGTSLDPNVAQSRDTYERVQRDCGNRLGIVDVTNIWRFLGTPRGLPAHFCGGKFNYGYSGDASGEY